MKASESRQLFGESYSMTLATCMSTGTLRSLKAVVMKQPNVSAAMTLREKANSEFALDKTVFIFQNIKYIKIGKLELRPEE